MTSQPYDNRFYDGIRDGSRRSASAVLPALLEMLKPFQPRSILDVGCGDGTWLSVLREEQGITDLHGVDGVHVLEAGALRIPREQFTPFDLGGDLDELAKKIDRVFDVCISLEVAEHLPRSQAERFVQVLTSKAAVVVFSAAIPFQDGTNHLNLEWPGEWANRFLTHDYWPIDELRFQLWDNPEVEFWYRQNIVTYVSGDLLAREPHLASMARATTKRGVPSLVHPVLYERNVQGLSLIQNSRRMVVANALARWVRWIPKPHRDSKEH